MLLCLRSPSVHSSTVDIVARKRCLMDIRPELQQFASASERLLGYETNQKELTDTERDLVRYYVETLAGKFSTFSSSDRNG